MKTPKINKNIIKELNDYLEEFNLTEIEYTEKDVKGKVIRLYRGGLDVAVQNAIIMLKLKNNNLYVGNLHGLEFTFIEKEIR